MLGDFLITFTYFCSTSILIIGPLVSFSPRPFSPPFPPHRVFIGTLSNSFLPSKVFKVRHRLLKFHMEAEIYRSNTLSKRAQASSAIRPAQYFHSLVDHRAFLLSQSLTDHFLPLCLGTLSITPSFTSANHASHISHLLFFCAVRNLINYKKMVFRFCP